MRAQFSKIDIFGVKPHFLFRGLQAHNSTLGVVLSLGVFGVVLLSLAFFSQNLINKESPNVFSFRRDFEQAPKTDITNLFFSIYNFYDNREYIIDPSCVKIDAYIRRVESSSQTINISRIPVELEPCSLNHFPQDAKIRANLVRVSLQNHYCLNKQSSKNLYIAGSFSDETSNVLFIEFRRCLNQTDESGGPTGVICKTNDEINDYVKKSIIGIFFLDSRIDTSNYEKPVDEYINMVFSKLAYSFYKQTLVHLFSGKVVTDKGFLWTSVGETSYLGISDQKEIASDIEEADLMSSLSIRMTKMEEVFTRKYDKIQDVLASTMGIGKLAFFVALVIIYPLSVIDYKRKFLNDIELFKFTDKADHTIDISNKKGRPLKDLISNSSNIILKDKYYVNSSEKIKFVLTGGYWKSEPMKEIEEKYNLMSKKLDIIYVLKMVREFKLLKEISLTKFQMDLLKILSRTDTEPQKIYRKRASKSKTQLDRRKTKTGVNDIKALLSKLQAKITNEVIKKPDKKFAQILFGFKPDKKINDDKFEIELSEPPHKPKELAASSSSKKESFS